MACRMTPRRTTLGVVALLAVVGLTVAFAGPVAAQPCDGDVDQENSTVAASCSESTEAGSGGGGIAADGSDDELNWDGEVSGQNDDFGGFFAWTDGNASDGGGDGTAGFWGYGFGQSDGGELSCTVTEDEQDCS